MNRYVKVEDPLLISVCEKFLREEKPGDIAEWLQKEHELPNMKRESIYPLLREARRRGYFSVLPPAEIALQQRICDRFQVEKESIHVVRVRGDTAPGYVADAAAKEIVGLIYEVARTKERVHLGLGGGATVQGVARALSWRLRSEVSLPPLGLHALSSGFDVNNPASAPVVFLGLFDQAAPDIEYVGLFAPAVVEAKAYQRQLTLPGVSESFQRAGEIDIVVTSLASASDDHGQLNRFMNLGEKKSKGLGALRRAGWVGDVAYRPYSETGPIETNPGIRAVSLFELKQLVDLAKKLNKHVVLVATPCGVCHEPKGEALRPLLTEESLRLWTHLVMDLTTAQSLLPQED